MQKLESLVNTLEKKIDYPAILNTEISKGSVGWHVEHVLLTLNGITKAIMHSNPREYKRKFSLAKFYVFAFKKIPVGSIQAPASMRPLDNFTKKSLRDHFKISCDSIRKLDSLERNNFFMHPFFGHLNIKSTKKFLQIHTRPHLNIIDKILMAEKKKINHITFSFLIRPLTNLI